MIERQSYLLVEGQQDVYFVGRIFQELGLKAARQPEHIPPRWEPFLDTFALQRDQAERAAGRSGVPFWQIFRAACLFSDTHSIIVERVDGNRASFGRTLRATNELIDGGLAGLTGVGLISDADTDPGASFASSREALRLAGLAVPDDNEEVIGGTPNTGIFVLPGDAEQGGLEELLIDCADVVYPELAKGARAFVGAVGPDSDVYTEDDMREFKKPQGRVKAIVGAVSTVLKPGSTIQVSIHRDRWICGASIGVPRVAALVRFLGSLCGLP